MNDALKWGIVHRNVAALVSPPTMQKKPIQPFTLEQSGKFLKAVEGSGLEALFSVAISPGLRKGEILGLRWQDIDFDSKTLFVNLALQEVQGKLELVELKTESSKRALPIPETLLAKLKAHRSRQLEEKLKLGTAWQDTGLVFVNTGAEKFTPNLSSDT